MHTLVILLQQAVSTGNDAKSWAELISSTGAVGALVFVVYLFLSGKVMSAKTAKAQIDSAVSAAKMSTSKELREELKKAVKEGFIEGWYEIHTSHQEAVDAAKNTPTAPVRKPGAKPKQ